LNAPDGKDEKSHPANVGIRPEALQAIEDLRSLIYKQCLPVVSCADILVVAAREAVRQVIFIHYFFTIITPCFHFLSFFYPFHNEQEHSFLLFSYSWEAQISMCPWEGKTALSLT